MVSCHQDTGISFDSVHSLQQTTADYLVKIDSHVTQVSWIKSILTWFHDTDISFDIVHSLQQTTVDHLVKIPMSHKAYGLSQYLHGFIPSGHRDIIWYCPFSPANHCWLLSEDSHVTQVLWIKSILTWFHAIRTQGYHLILSILSSKPLLTTQWRFPCYAGLRE